MWRLMVWNSNPCRHCRNYQRKYINILFFQLFNISIIIVHGLTAKLHPYHDNHVPHYWVNLWSIICFDGSGRKMNEGKTERKIDNQHSYKLETRGLGPQYPTYLKVMRYIVFSCNWKAPRVHDYYRLVKSTWPRSRSHVSTQHFRLSAYTFPVKLSF